MKDFVPAFRRFVAGDNGVMFAEYALLLALITLVVAAAAAAFSAEIAKAFNLARMWLAQSQ